MKVGDVVFYNDDSDGNVDYVIVRSASDYVYWAYWIKEEETLTFTPTRSCYSKVGPSVIGKWK